MSLVSIALNSEKFEVKNVICQVEVTITHIIGIQWRNKRVKLPIDHFENITPVVISNKLSK